MILIMALLDGSSLDQAVHCSAGDSELLETNVFLKTIYNPQTV